MNIIFVCTDNFSRSVTAELCAKKFLEDRNINGIKVFSAGIDINRDISNYLRTHFERMKTYGIDLESIAPRKQLSANMINESNIIVAMSAEHKQEIETKYGVKVVLYEELANNKSTTLLPIKYADFFELEAGLIEMVDYIYMQTPAVIKNIIENY